MYKAKRKFDEVKKGHKNTGKCFEVVHAGTSDEFVEDAGLFFSTKSNSADYYDSLNNKTFKSGFVKT